MNALMVSNYSPTRGFNEKAVNNFFQLHKPLLLQFQTLSTLVASYSVTHIFTYKPLPGKQQLHQFQKSPTKQNNEPREPKHFSLLKSLKIWESV